MLLFLSVETFLFLLILSNFTVVECYFSKVNVVNSIVYIVLIVVTIALFYGKNTRKFLNVLKNACVFSCIAI